MISWTNLVAAYPIAFALCVAPLVCTACGADAGASIGNSGAGGGSAGASTGGQSGSGGAVGVGEFRSDYKTSASFFTRMSTPADSGSVHGVVRIWYSSNVAALATSGPFVVPEGTVAIKDEYDSSGAVLVKVVMIKKASGYDATHHDWYYEARGPDDSLAANPVPGTPSLCVSCHSGAPDTDYLQG
ncbi:MAG: hypothetical protein ABI548_17560, partial [Polyangiaceae bacterium]